MSRKKRRYRNKGGQKKNTASGVSSAEAVSEKTPALESSIPQSNLLALLSAFDGYSNAAAFLGEDSPLLSSGTFRRSGLTRETELLTTAYRENWIAKRIIDMPCEDMTRAWYKLSTSLPEAAVRDLHRLEAWHNVKQEIANAIRWARLYGGSIALIVLRGEENRLDQPIDYDLLLPNCFQGLLVLDRAQGIEPSQELVTDLDDPDFGLPMYYTVELETGSYSESSIQNSKPTAAAGRRSLDFARDDMRDAQDDTGAGNMVWNGTDSATVKPLEYANDSISYHAPVYQSVKIHHSRVLRFVGRELPYMEMVAENYWGASELEHIWDELQKRNATSANIAQLVFQANITTLKMGHLGQHLAMGTEKQRLDALQAMETENRLRTSFGLQIMNADDSLENHSYSFGGLSEIYEAFMMDMAGAAEIPATKLFGRSPQGMNSTGEADLRNYYDMIAQMQERCLRPALEKLVPIMAISCWAYVPNDLEIVFQPIMTTSPAEKAELVQKLTSDVIEAFKCGLITREEALAELESRGEALGVYTKIRVESFFQSGE